MRSTPGSVCILHAQLTYYTRLRRKRACALAGAQRHDWLHDDQARRLCDADLQSEYEVERAELEARYKARLQELRVALEDEEAAAKRNLRESSESVVAEYRRQMQVGSKLLRGCGLSCGSHGDEAQLHTYLLWSSHT